MDTSRAVINITDNSDTFVQETTQITGFTVVKAPKGPITPVRIRKGGAAELKDIFGVSSKDYPELFEVETFNREYDLYVSAPYSAGTKVPVAYLTNQGVVVGSELMTYSTMIEQYALGEIDDPHITFTSGSNIKVLLNMKYPEKYGFKGGVPKEEKIPSSPKNGNISAEGLVICTGIVVKDVYTEGGLTKLPTSFEIVSADETKKATYTIDGTDVKLNSTTVGHLYKKDANNDLVLLTLDATSSPADTSIIYISYESTAIPNTLDPNVRETLKLYWVKTVTPDDIHAVIFPKYPSERTLHISFADFSDFRNYSSKDYRSWNTLKMTVCEDGAFRDSTHPIYVEGSLDFTDRGSDGSFIGFSGLNSSYMSQNLVCVYPVHSFTNTDTLVTTITGFGPIDLGGGKRIFDKTSDIHEAGWVAAGEGEYSDVDIFFDSEIHDHGVVGYPEVNKKFLSLATDDVTSHELAGYIFNETVTPTELDNASVNLSNLKLGHGKNYWNTCNVGIIEDRINGTRFSSALTGAKALMQARIIEAKMGGVAPMWENSSVGGLSVGGQLNMITVYKLKYKYNKQQLDILDDLNYNPIINDRQYGIMAVGQKTCKDGKTTDWSYIGHACAFFNFLKQVRANVMLPQIGKPNNPYYRTLRKDQVDLYLGQRINGSDRIWAEAECDTSTADGVNDVHALKARKFVIKVRVKVDVFSEKVELNFTNEGQDTIISMAQ